MTSRHSVRLRDASPEELENLQRSTRADAAASLGCGLLIAVGLGFVTSEVIIRVTGQRELRLFLAVAVSLAIVLLFGVSLYRFLRKQRRRVDLDLEGRVVEVLEIESDEAVELLADHSSVDPTVVVDLGSDRLLLLAGQWLRDPAVYGASGYSELDDPPWLNGLEPPFAFPSTQFSLERWPKSGEVLSIEVSGEYLNPSQRTSETQPTDLRPLPSQVVTGSLSDLDRSLELLAKQRSG